MSVGHLVMKPLSAVKPTCVLPRPRKITRKFEPNFQAFSLTIVGLCISARGHVLADTRRTPVQQEELRLYRIKSHPADGSHDEEEGYLRIGIQAGRRQAKVYGHIDPPACAILDAYRDGKLSFSEAIDKLGKGVEPVH
jgi:hypothetical protein